MHYLAPSKGLQGDAMDSAMPETLIYIYAYGYFTQHIVPTCSAS